MRFSRREMQRPFLSLFLIAFLTAGFAAAAENDDTAKGEESGDPRETPAGEAVEPGGHAPAAGEAEEGTTLPFRVLGNFFFEFPGLDTHTLTPVQRQRFLQRVNQELCGCGSCRRDTVANCYINDPSCRFVHQQAKKILNEVRAGK